MGTTLGCDRRAAVRASRRNRSRVTGWAASGGGSTLSATRRSSRSSRARKTTPMPPRPSSRWTWNWPTSEVARAGNSRTNAVSCVTDVTDLWAPSPLLSPRESHHHVLFGAVCRKHRHQDCRPGARLVVVLSIGPGREKRHATLEGLGPALLAHLLVVMRDDVGRLETRPEPRGHR